MTPEFKSRIEEFIPESDTVKMVYSSIKNNAVGISNWSDAIEHKIDKALAGDENALTDLLEMTKLSAYNEGMLAAVSPAPPVEEGRFGRA